MGDYGSDQARFLDDQERAHRDGAFFDNINAVSEYLGVPPDEVIGALRGGRVYVDDDLNPLFPRAPSGLTDPELAAWAVQYIPR